MSCIRCGGKAGNNLVHRNDIRNSYGLICDRCVSQLLSGRQTQNNCGEAGCDQVANYGTSKQVQMFDPGSRTPSNSATELDQYLLCDDHYEELTD